MIKKEIFGMNLEELQGAFGEFGIKKYRAMQVFRWLYEKGAVSFEEMTNLSKADRELLSEHFNLGSGSVKAIRELASGDGLTNKVLLEFPDKACVETVVMHHDYGYSVCLSSQVGCNMNCAFCASGISGFERNLTAGEILAQVYYFKDCFRSKVKE
jgi:23S rRNA (adenine2503-C2)-methyltransferase